MKGRVEQLDGLRGIFAVLVVAHHHIASKESIFYDNFFLRTSDLFVEFFFVLSGFVIALNYFDRIKNTTDFWNFWKKRFIRLYPLLVYTELLFLILNLVGDQSVLKKVAINDGSFYFFTVLDTLTFMGSTPIFGAWAGLNYPSWSISAEMIAYTVFGTVLLLFPRNKILAFAILTLLCTGFLIYNGEYLVLYDYGFVRGILCFCTGVFTYLFLRNKSFNLTAWEIPYLVLLVGAMYVSYHQQLNLEKLAFPIIFAIGIVVFCNSKGIITKMLLTAPIQYLGKISYSIYLNHAIVLIAVNIVLFRMTHIAPTEPMVALSLILSIALTILYSNFTYNWIEVKVGKYLRSKF